MNLEYFFKTKLINHDVMTELLKTLGMDDEDIKLASDEIYDKTETKYRRILMGIQNKDVHNIKEK